MKLHATTELKQSALDISTQAMRFFDDIEHGEIGPDGAAALDELGRLIRALTTEVRLQAVFDIANAHLNTPKETQP